ncbi:MAG: three-Cys-motif partner protein TcmP [Endomicrobium sp.]|jgi:three-Cys-motif partner protein|nr:three-Cys-motif partner protein TcmP [Endomicrobium sp.]
MNKKGHIEIHSKQKLDVYKKYLEAYLSIMMNVSYCKDIFIVEPFAGSGISENKKNGSAVIAKNVINSVSTSIKEDKTIYLYLNEYKKDYHDSLVKNVGPDEKTIKIYNKEANEFITNILNMVTNRRHKFFFIDPWGYTQIDKNTYTRLFEAAKLDFLIFIPIYHIYRFLRKEEDAHQLTPIANFLSDIGINENDAKKSSTIEDFAEKIRSAVSHKARTEYAYYKILKNVKSNSRYALFFSTKHILGAEKFLEALEQIKEKDLFENTISDQDSAFIKTISAYKKLTNCDLYKFGILNSLLSKKVNIILTNFEKNGKIEVISMITKRRKGNFYIGYKYYGKPPKLEIVSK